jgi:predicted helicase
MQEVYYIIESCAISNKTKEINSLFPLYTEKSLLEKQGSPNLSPDFLTKLNNNLGYSPAPESIFYYIYAILHSPTYRDCYAEFLKIDFPRVPLTSNDQLFRLLVGYGEQLVQLHLMISPKLDNLITEFVKGEGERIVAPGHPKYKDGAVKLNTKCDRFTGVPEEAWNFYVGGYQPCQKWLKDRKERTLSDEDILHYQKMVVSLKETIALMTKINQAIPGFPIQ